MKSKNKWRKKYEPRLHQQNPASGNFLCLLYSQDMKIVASILTMQAEGRTEDLIKELCVVRDFSQSLINKLMEEGL